ncbi:MAG: RHS repeat-associated core domain-containing protein [Syntrophaceticus schinkii]
MRGTADYNWGSETPFLFNGKYGVMSDENGLYYLRKRYYNPDIKRFINLDVLLGSIDEGQSLNRYAYVNSNPVLYTDPFGLCAEDIGPLTAGFLWEISNSGLFGIPSVFSDY